MRVLVVHNRYLQFGGEDTTFEQEVSLLRRNGHDVETLVFDNLQIVGLWGIIRTAASLFYNFNSRRRITAVLYRFEPDIIHVHNFFYVASPSIFYAARRRGTPVIVTLQNFRLICSGALLMRDAQVCELCVKSTFPISGIRYKCHRHSRAQTAALTAVTAIHKVIGTWNNVVSHYIAVTEFTKGKFVNSSLAIVPDRISVKPNSTKDFGVGSERGSQFLYVGRLAVEKGIDALIRAFLNSDFELRVIGDGPLGPLVRHLAKSNSRISFLGLQRKEKVIEELKRCKALVFPSVWYECLPLTIIEAFSTGTPVVISDIDNLNSIVTDGFDGVHFKTNDSDSLEGALKRLCRVLDEGVDLNGNARKTYLEKYSEGRNYEQLLSIYEKVLRHGEQ